MTQDFSGIIWPGWNVEGILGHGSYGRVYAIERDVFAHTEKAALKVISIPQNDGEIEELYNDGYALSMYQVDTYPFYVKEDGEIVIPFPTYSIAAGAEGCIDVPSGLRCCT